MTYCLGIVTKRGLVMASDSRTNSGADQVTTCRKMHTFVKPGERAFVMLTSGSLSATQSVLTLLRRDFDAGQGLAVAPTMYDAARVVGQQIRKVADLDREFLERDRFTFNVNIILGGQIAGEEPQLFLVYPQGNPLRATEEAPYLQIGETKYGKPILDRGIRFDQTSLEEACKYALLSLDSTMKSNVTVGPPVDLLVYEAGELALTRHRKFGADDPDLMKIRLRWEQALRAAVQKLPQLRFRAGPVDGVLSATKQETIELVEPQSSAEGAAEQVSQASQRQPDK